MFLPFFRSKVFQFVKAAVEAARTDNKNIVLDSSDNILKIVDPSGTTKAIEPNSGFNGEKITKRFDFDFDGEAGNGAIGNIVLMPAFAAGDAVVLVKWLKTGDGLEHEGETAATLKLALATDGDVTAVVEDDDATIGINDKGILFPVVTYRKASAAQALRLVIGGAAVTGNCAVEIEYQKATYIAANNPVEVEE
jgi:hypothetical protein